MLSKLKALKIANEQKKAGNESNVLKAISLMKLILKTFHSLRINLKTFAYYHIARSIWRLNFKCTTNTTDANKMAVSKSENLIESGKKVLRKRSTRSNTKKPVLHLILVQ